MSIRHNIIKLRKLFGITQEQLAEIAGVSRGAVSQWEGGFSEPRMGSIQKMADHFGISKSNIIEDDGMDLIDPMTKASRKPLPKGAIPVRGTSAMVPVRVLGKTHAGMRMDEEEINRVAEFPEGVVNRHPESFALEVEGDCMNKRYPEGCLILVDPAMQPRNGAAVVAEFEDGTSVLRCYFRGQSALILTADSFTEHEDIVVTQCDSPVRLVGVVVWYQASTDEE